MNLIFITRKVDRGDALTGFIFTWIEKLAFQLEKLYVICQEKGDISGLPQNIEVHSFGKERGFGKLRQAFTLFVLSFIYAKKVNGFFVHMHPIYAILAWPAAKLYGKKMVLWYTHKSVDLKLKIAHALVDRVFTASKESFRLPSKKVKIVGHGIDVEKFTPSYISPYPAKGRDRGRKSGGKFRILSIGRISPVKDYETLIKAAEILREKGQTNFEVKIYGRIGLPEHQAYLDSLVTFVHNADLEDYIKFQGELTYEFVPQVLQEADVFVNLSQTGSIDKSVLEAAAGSTLVLTSNEAFKKPLGAISPLFIFHRNDPSELAERLLRLKQLTEAEKKTLGQKLRLWVLEEHNLENLISKIIAEYT